MNNPIKFWNKTSKKYDNSVYQKYKEVYEATISLTKKHLKPEDNVLDFACGTGFITIALSDHVNRILAIDISDKMIEQAQQKLTMKQVKNVAFENRSIFDSNLIPGSFAVILAFNIFQFIEDEDELMTRMHELLRQDGLLISATDCYNEKKSGIILLMKMLSKLKFLPYVKSITCRELEASLIRNKFELLERMVLNKKPVNYFIAARKQK